MNLENFRIVADDREQKSGIPRLLKSIGMEVEVKTLQVGDYIVSPETIVERKSIRDLLSSIFDGRLFDQCGRLKEHYKHPVVVMEGNVDEIEEIVENAMVFYGAVSKVALDFGIPVMPTPSASHTAKLLVAMCARRESSAGPYLKKIKKYDDLERQQLSVLCSLPGVGEKFAARMLERFGTPRDALTASSVDLAKVAGLGQARARKITKALSSKSSLARRSRQQTLEPPG